MGNSALYIFLIWAMIMQANLFDSWSFITKQTLLYRNRLLKASLCSAIYNDRSLANHEFSPSLTGEHKMPRWGTVSVLLQRTSPPRLLLPWLTRQKKTTSLCSPCPYSGATRSSRGHLRLFQELSNGISNIFPNYFILFLQSFCFVSFFKKNSNCS